MAASVVTNHWTEVDWTGLDWTHKNVRNIKVNKPPEAKFNHTQFLRAANGV